MTIEIKPGMRFRHKTKRDRAPFRVERYDLYADGKPILVAVTDKLIYDLDDVDLSAYEPYVDGRWLSGEIEYHY